MKNEKHLHPRGEKSKVIPMTLEIFQLNKVYLVPRSLHLGDE